MVLDLVKLTVEINHLKLSLNQGGKRARNLVTGPIPGTFKGVCNLPPSTPDIKALVLQAAKQK
jgi:hypothetical protein